jgi:phosphoglycolate phosphatase
MYGDSYVPADIEPTAYAWLEQPVRRIDLCTPSAFLDKESVQGLVHCHVLEHVPADLTTTLIEMNAAIESGGFHVFCVPFLGKYYSEDANPDTSREEREARYGQWDHIRAFGTSDFFERIRFAFEGFTLVNLGNSFTVRDMQLANIPSRSLTSLTSHTVFFFQKHA